MPLLTGRFRPPRRAAWPSAYSWRFRPGAAAQQGGTGRERPDAAGPVPAQAAVHAQVPAWAENRNAAPKGIHWQVRTADARVRLKRLHPTIET